ncbi:MAG: isochorismate synthase [Actinomycetota bacterium]|nr:isochorismate synthase [Actinomycetota bacterium]
MVSALDTLADRLDELAGRWNGRSRRLVSVTVEADLSDPVGAVVASRLAADRWFAWEEPDRGFALAGLGTAAEVVSRGEGRFGDLSRECAEILRNRISDEPAGLPAGAGPVWTGGLSFAEDGGASAHWSSLPPALLVLPELSVARDDQRTFLTAATTLAPGADPSQRLAALRARIAGLADRGLPLLDPSAFGQVRVASAADPSAFERAVARAVERIRAGELEKVVLAREVRAEAPRAHDPAALFGALRELFPSCYCFCVGTPEAAFLGASPELLVRRRGAGAQTVALAGSTRRSADPAVDDHLGEQLSRSAKNRQEHAIVVRRIERALRPHSVWVEASGEPVLVKVANIQHLATPIHAQLADPRSAVELAGVLHPTPAVGGEPGPEAVEAIGDLERLDRGWYAGPVGWMDATEDGEFCVALRSALLRDRTAHLFAGAGIVAESDPEAELAETELKLDALLPLVSS